MKSIIAISLTAALALAATLIAQPDVGDMPDMPDFDPPAREHAWLDKLVGEWESRSVMTMGPGQPEAEVRGEAEVESLGGFWVVCELEGNMPGDMKMEAVLTLGYDAEKGHYVGTWIDSMTSMMWHYEGELDRAEQVLTLTTSGPNFADPTKTANYKDVITIRSDDEWTWTSSSDMAGEWMTFMEATFTRDD